MTAREAFLQAVNEISAPDPSNPPARVWDNAIHFYFSTGKEATLSPLGNTDIYLEDLYATQTGQGVGSRAMNTFNAIADDHQVTIYVHASTDPKNQNRLERFYIKHGFQKVEGQLMKRPPSHARQN